MQGEKGEVKEKAMNQSRNEGAAGRLDTMMYSGLMKKTPNPKGRAGEPISLHPLSFEDAVAGLAQVKPPEPENKKPKAKPKKGSG